MEWLAFGKTQIELKTVRNFECICDYHYPESFIDIVLKFNGGTPEHMTYNTKETEGRVFNNLLSFEEEDIESVWKLLEQDNFSDKVWGIEGLDWQYIPFACDPFGNYICFDRTNDHILFWNHETTAIEEVADSFTEFIDSLYAFDEEGFFAKYMKR